MSVTAMAKLNLAPLLQEAGVSGNQLAEELEVSRNTVSNWLKGSDRGMFEHLIQLRDFFSKKLNRRLTIDDLIKEEDS